MASTSKSELTAVAFDRIKKELRELKTDPKPDIFAVTDEQDIRTLHALVIGAVRTPYEGGFFYFIVQYPNDYPSQPPKVRLMTTANNKIRFNPNLYADGTVCVSVLNTWDGNPWSPALTVSTLLLSIQTLMNEEPYYNEPGYEKSNGIDESSVEQYNNFVRHETIRVAVCDMLEDSNIDTRKLPEELRSIMQKRFIQDYEKYVAIVTSNLSLDGSRMRDHFDGHEDTFNFKEILQRLHAVKKQLQSTQ